MTPLKKVRRARRQTLVQVAQACETDAGNLSRVERGLQQASPALAARLALHFGGEITELQVLYPRRWAA